MRQISSLHFGKSTKPRRPSFVGGFFTGSGNHGFGQEWSLANLAIIAT
jgi:hypothetical protein